MFDTNSQLQCRVQYFGDWVKPDNVLHYGELYKERPDRVSGLGHGTRGRADDSLGAGAGGEAAPRATGRGGPANPNASARQCSTRDTPFLATFASQCGNCKTL